MGGIRLEDGVIEVDGEWLTSEEIGGRIQDKMASGDMKFANLASALEELNAAMENSRVISVTVAVTKDEYARMIERGGGDERECVRKAIQAYVSGAASDQGLQSGEMVASNAGRERKAHVKCAKCRQNIVFDADNPPAEIRCPYCGAAGKLKLPPSSAA